MTINELGYTNWICHCLSGEWSGNQFQTPKSAFVNKLVIRHSCSFVNIDYKTEFNSL
jgi:hypothetical protein